MPLMMRARRMSNNKVEATFHGGGNRYEPAKVPDRYKVKTIDDGIFKLTQTNVSFSRTGPDVTAPLDYHREIYRENLPEEFTYDELPDDAVMGWVIDYIDGVAQEPVYFTKGDLYGAHSIRHIPQPSNDSGNSVAFHPSRGAVFTSENTKNMKRDK